jgi:hypothetical protein
LGGRAGAFDADQIIEAFEEDQVVKNLHDKKR